MISAGDKQVREETIAKYVNLNFHYYTRLVSFPLSVLPTMNHDQLLTMTLANWEVLALRYLSWRLPVSHHNDCIDGIDDPRNVSQQCQHQAYQELTLRKQGQDIACNLLRKRSKRISLFWNILFSIL